MVISSPGEEWIIKLGPISRTNQAGSRAQAEEGASQKVDEDAKAIMEKARELVPLFLKGAVCAGDCTPQVKEDMPELTVVSYQLDDGKWFSIASSGFFGMKLTCKK